MPSGAPDGDGSGRTDSAAAHVMYLSPSLTPRNPTHEPSIRLYRYQRSTGQPIDFEDFTLDLPASNREGRAAWSRRPTALHTPPLNLSDLSASEWARGLRRVLSADHRPSVTDELRADDPFLSWMSPARCAREAYVGSGSPHVPPLRKVRGCRAALSHGAQLS